nr:uncharacterized protein LOC121131722 [Lepeophtheirus salmonis]
MNLGWETQEDEDTLCSQSQRTLRIKKTRWEVLLLALGILMNNIFVLPCLIYLIIKELNLNYEYSYALYSMTSASGLSLIGSILLIFGSITRNAKFNLYFLYVNLFIATAHWFSFLSFQNSKINIFQNTTLSNEILRNEFHLMIVFLVFVLSDVCIGYFIYLDFKEIEKGKKEKTGQPESI